MSTLPQTTETTKTTAAETSLAYDLLKQLHEEGAVVPPTRTAFTMQLLRTLNCSAQEALVEVKTMERLYRAKDLVQLGYRGSTSA